MQLLVKPAVMLASFEVKVGFTQHAMNMLKMMIGKIFQIVLLSITIFGLLLLIIPGIGIVIGVIKTLFK